LRRLIIVTLVVVAAAVVYRSYGDAGTGTGTLTLPQPAPNVGERAPTFTARTVDGGMFRLSEEGVYVLTFWSTLNEGSIEARPEFARLAREYEDAGVSFAAVYVSEVPGSDGAPYARISDSSGALTSLYNIKRVPRLFLVADGRIRLVHNGYYEESEEQLREALEETLPREEAG
jgi:thiol-disulfide isomerase/thioredoxin